MSTADSQLLVASSAICHDLSLSQKEFTLKETRIVVTAVCLIAGLTALFIDKSIYSQVLFAFSAMGSAFGPLVIGRIQGFVDNKLLIEVEDKSNPYEEGMIGFLTENGAIQSDSISIE